MSLVVECGGCGGAVVYDASAEMAACIFCGSPAVEQREDETVLVPELHLPVRVEKSNADQQYRDWARSSWWHPKVLRSLSVDLGLLLIPSWRFEADVETHWNGLASAATRSGKRPTGGRAETRLVHMLPASQGITSAELNELEPFDMEQAAPWTGPEQGAPYELPGMSEQAARVQMHSLMSGAHRRRISSDHGLYNCVASSLVSNEEVVLLVVPVYIGAFRFRDRPWRFVVNAQTGEVVGEAPIDRVKVALVVVGTLAAMALALAFLAA
jgi:hypothetical protein